jgi:hypothetical protein
MTHVQTLIDKAATKLGSKAALARSLGVPQPTIQDWYSGRKAISPADRARVAYVAGDDPREELITATIERHKGTLKGDQLQQALGRAASRAIGKIKRVIPRIRTLAKDVVFLDAAAP